MVCQCPFSGTIFQRSLTAGAVKKRRQESIPRLFGCHSTLRWLTIVECGAYWRAGFLLSEISICFYTASAGGLRKLLSNLIKITHTNLCMPIEQDSPSVWFLAEIRSIRTLSFSTESGQSRRWRSEQTKSAVRCTPVINQKSKLNGCAFQNSEFTLSIPHDSGQQLVCVPDPELAVNLAYMIHHGMVADPHALSHCAM